MAAASQAVALIGVVLISVVASSRETWPWSSLCYKRYEPYNFTAKECLVSERSDLPVFDASDEYEVLLLARPVEGVPGGKSVSSLIGFTHTALGFKRRNGPEELMLEFFAVNLGADVVMPTIRDGRFDWRDHAVIAWLPNIDEQWIEKVPLGVTNGTTLNAFMSWVPVWHDQHSSYELFSAWSDPELKKGMTRYFNETTCNTFVEEAIWELYKLGVQLSSSGVLCRNYFVFITKNFSFVESNGLHGSLQRFEMEAYYQALGAIRAKANHSHVPLERWLEMAAVTVMEMLQPAVYLYNHPAGIYYFAKLDKPYMHLSPLYLNQRMVLPWQRAEDARLGECDPWASVDTFTSVESVIV